VSEPTVSTMGPRTSASPEGSWPGSFCGSSRSSTWASDIRKISPFRVPWVDHLGAATDQRLSRMDYRQVSLGVTAPVLVPRLFRFPPIRLTYAEHRRVTDGTRTRDLRSHNPYEHVRVCPASSFYVVYLRREPCVRGAGHPYVFGCVLASIAAALLPRIDPSRSPVLRNVTLPFASGSTGRAQL
jgi:hypothetical protein